VFGPLGEGCRESRRCSGDTYPESYITKYTSIRRTSTCLRLTRSCFVGRDVKAENLLLTAAGDVQVMSTRSGYEATFRQWPLPQAEALLGVWLKGGGERERRRESATERASERESEREITGYEPLGHVQAEAPPCETLRSPTQQVMITRSGYEPRCPPRQTSRAGRLNAKENIRY